MAKAASKSSKGGKKPFGGFSINFKGVNEPLSSVFGEAPIGPAEMTKKLWAFVKRKKLSGKS